MSKRPVKRRYHSEVRAAAAEGTRAAITAAARRLFASEGYTATPIDRIALEAGEVWLVDSINRLILDI